MKTRVFLLAAAFAAVLAASPTSVSEPYYWRYAHPDAKMLAGLDFRQIWHSPLGDMLRAQFADLKVNQVGGADILEGLDRIFISASGNLQKGKDASVLAVLSGRFDLARLRQLAASEKAAVKWYKGVELIVPPQSKGDDAYFAILDSQTALVASRPVLFAAIDRSKAGQSGPLSSANPLYARAMQMAASHEAWLVGVAPPPEALGQAAAANPMLANLRSMDLGISLRDGLGMEALLMTSSPESAQQMAMGLQLMMGMAMAGKGNTESPQVAEILRSLQVRAESGGVRISLQVSRERLEAGIREMRASMNGTMAGVRSAVRSNVQMSGDTGGLQALERLAQNRAAVPAAAPPPPEPPRKMVIRIEGMDDGPVEIPYKKQ